MVLGDKAPVTGIQRVIAVVAHHEIVMLAEGVFTDRFARNQQGSVHYLSAFEVLLIEYGLPVYRKGRVIDGDSHSCSRDG